LWSQKTALWRATAPKTTPGSARVIIEPTLDLALAGRPQRHLECRLEARNGQDVRPSSPTGHVHHGLGTETALPSQASVAAITTGSFQRRRHMTGDSGLYRGSRPKPAGGPCGRVDRELNRSTNVPDSHMSTVVVRAIRRYSVYSTGQASGVGSVCRPNERGRQPDHKSPSCSPRNGRWRRYV
jgi:hypothetical protein